MCECRQWMTMMVDGLTGRVDGFDWEGGWFAPIQHC